jgi:hypothetical protein
MLVSVVKEIANGSSLQETTKAKIAVAAKQFDAATDPLAHERPAPTASRDAGARPAWCRATTR